MLTPTELKTLYDSWLDHQKVSSSVLKGEIYDPWRLRILSLADFQQLAAGEMISEQQLAYLAAFGILAPTTHNTVPQKWKLDPTHQTLECWIDRRYVLAVSDKYGRQATISMGCVIKYIEMAARCFGLAASSEFADLDPRQLFPYHAQESRYTLLGKITFARTNTPAWEPRWLQAMLERKNLRTEYNKVTLPLDISEKLQERVQQNYANVQLHLVTDALTKLALAEFQEQAMNYVMNDEHLAFARELGDWLLENSDHAAKRGMRVHEFGMDNPTYSTRIQQGLQGKLPPDQALRPDEIASFARAEFLRMNSASAIGVITIAEDTPQQRIAAGQAYAEIALALHMQGYCTAMSAAITEADLQLPRKALMGRLRTKQRPVVIFCVGKPQDGAQLARPHAARPGLVELFTFIQDEFRGAENHK